RHQRQVVYRHLGSQGGDALADGHAIFVELAFEQEARHHRAAQSFERRATLRRAALVGRDGRGFRTDVGTGHENTPWAEEEKRRELSTTERPPGRTCGVEPLRS